MHQNFIEAPNGLHTIQENESLLDDTNENVGVIEMLNDYHDDIDYAKIIGFVNSKV